MEACLGEFVSYQTVSASEEAFHKEGTCVRYCVDGCWRDLSMDVNSIPHQHTHLHS